MTVTLCLLRQRISSSQEHTVSNISSLYGWFMKHGFNNNDNNNNNNNNNNDDNDDNDNDNDNDNNNNNNNFIIYPRQY